MSDGQAERIRVLVADDHPVVRAGLVALIGAMGDMAVVAEAADGSAAIRAWAQVRPDLAVIDLSMPVQDGFAAVAGIRAHDADARIVVMTTLCGDEDVYRAVRAGASGFLLKDCEPEEFAACLRTVAAGGRHFQPAAAASLAERVTRDELTEREAEVLRWVAEGLSNKVIGRRLGMAEGTVKTHLKSIVRKLDVASRTQAAHVAVARGLVRDRARG